MVSFTELGAIIKKNPTRAEQLPVWKVVEPARIWKIAGKPPTLPPAPAPAPTPAPAATLPPAPAPAPPPMISIRPYGRPVDPICIGISDLLYNGAPLLTAREMEKEEAIRLEALIPTIYSKEGGRSRGWTKKMLETHLRARASIGGDLFELRRAKVEFSWADLFTSKEVSALFDFMCLAKEIRCIVWKDSFHFGLWPAADPAVLAKEPRLLHISLEGEARLARGPESLQSIFTWADRTPGVGWTPALSCLSILSSKTVPELAADAAEVGITVEGKKSEQIVQIAAARRRRQCVARS